MSPIGRLIVPIESVAIGNLRAVINYLCARAIWLHVKTKALYMVN